MKEDKLFNDRKNLNTKINKLKKEKKTVDKELKKIEKKKEEKAKKREQKFHYKIEEIYDECVKKPMGDLWEHDRYYHKEDEEKDSRLIRKLTSSKEDDCGFDSDNVDGCDYEDFNCTWEIEGIFDEVIEEAERNFEGEKKHLEGLKKFKKVILDMIGEKKK